MPKRPPAERWIAPPGSHRDGPPRPRTADSASRRERATTGGTLEKEEVRHEMHRHAWKTVAAAALRRPFGWRLPGRIDLDRAPMFQVVLHCLDCGACCRARDGTILIEDADIERWRVEGYAHILDSLEPGHFGQMAFKMGPDHRCVFQGTDDNPYACRIYGHRATICRTFEKGCPQCLDIRRNRHDFDDG